MKEILDGRVVIIITIAFVKRWDAVSAQMGITTLMADNAVDAQRGTTVQIDTPPLFLAHLERGVIIPGNIVKILASHATLGPSALFMGLLHVLPALGRRCLDTMRLNVLTYLQWQRN